MYAIRSYYGGFTGDSPLLPGIVSIGAGGVASSVSNAPVYVVGEVVFDLFPGGGRVLGGAPFNVAWHLQAFGNRPQLISRVGDDEPGREVLQAMQAWGMSIAGVQIDHEHPTGQVAVELVDHEPRYQIVPDCSYNFV